MTDREKLEKIKKLADAMYYAAQQLTIDASRLHKAMDEYHKFIIHECKEESVRENLICVAKQYVDNHVFGNEEDKFSHSVYVDMFCSGANWQKEQDKQWLAEEHKHIFAKGMEKMKEQLLSKAVDAIVKIDAGGYPYVDRTIELYDYLQDIPLAKCGDKVKILVIKKD